MAVSHFQTFCDKQIMQTVQFSLVLWRLPNSIGLGRDIPRCIWHWNFLQCPTHPQFWLKTCKLIHVKLLIKEYLDPLYGSCYTTSGGNSQDLLPLAFKLAGNSAGDLWHLCGFRLGSGRSCGQQRTWAALDELWFACLCGAGLGTLGPPSERTTADDSKSPPMSTIISCDFYIFLLIFWSNLPADSTRLASCSKASAWFCPPMMPARIHRISHGSTLLRRRPPWDWCVALAFLDTWLSVKECTIWSSWILMLVRGWT